MPRKLSFTDNASGLNIEVDWLSDLDPTDGDLEEIAREARSQKNLKQLGLSAPPVPGKDYNPAGSQESVMDRAKQLYHPIMEFAGKTAELTNMLTGHALERMNAPTPRGFQNGQNELGQLIGAGIRGAYPTELLPPDWQERAQGYTDTLGGVVADPLMLAALPSRAGIAYIPGVAEGLYESGKRGLAGDKRAQGEALGQALLLGGLVHGARGEKAPPPKPAPVPDAVKPPGSQTTTTGVPSKATDSLSAVPEGVPRVEEISPLPDEVRTRAAEAVASQNRDRYHQSVRTAFPNVPTAQMDVALWLTDKFAARVKETAGVDFYDSPTLGEARKGLETSEQGHAQGELGQTIVQDGKVIMEAFQGHDFSTLIHETTHVIKKYLGRADLNILESWLGIEGGKWERGHEEALARATEHYTKTRGAEIIPGRPIPAELAGVFARMKAWMVEIYATVSRGLESDPNFKPMSPEVKAWFDEVVIGKPEAPPPVVPQPVRPIRNLPLRPPEQLLLPLKQERPLGDEGGKVVDIASRARSSVTIPASHVGAKIELLASQGQHRAAELLSAVSTYMHEGMKREKAIESALQIAANMRKPYKMDEVVTARMALDDALREQKKGGKVLPFSRGEEPLKQDRRISQQGDREERRSVDQRAMRIQALRQEAERIYNEEYKPLLAQEEAARETFDDQPIAEKRALAFKKYKQLVGIIDAVKAMDETPLKQERKERKILPFVPRSTSPREPVSPFAPKGELVKSYSFDPGVKKSMEQQLAMAKRHWAGKPDKNQLNLQHESFIRDFPKERQDTIRTLMSHPRGIELLMEQQWGHMGVVEGKLIDHGLTVEEIRSLLGRARKADLFALEEIRSIMDGPFDEGPLKQTRKEEPYDPWGEIKKGKLKTGSRLNAVVALKMYTKPPTETLPRELVQNAVDAIPPDVKGDVRLEINVEPTYLQELELKRREPGYVFKEATIVASDNGVGMSPRTIAEKFLVPGESYKPFGNRGAFGLAKAAILGSAKHFTLSTVSARPDGTKVRSVLEATGREFLDNKISPKRIVSVEAPPGTPTGTRLVIIPQDSVANQLKGLRESWQQDNIQQMVSVSESPHDIAVIINGKRIDVDPKQKATIPVRSVDTPTATLNFSRVPGGENSTYIHVKNGGMYQFDTYAHPGFGKQPAGKYAVDIVIKDGVDPAKDPEYPFTSSRDGISPGTKVAEAIREFAAEESRLVSEAQQNETRKIFAEALPIEGTKAKFHDASGTLSASVRERVINSRSTQLLAKIIQQAFEAISHRRTRLFEVSEVEFGGLYWHPGQYGIHVPGQWLGKSLNQVLINPWLNFSESYALRLDREIDQQRTVGKMAGIRPEQQIRDFASSVFNLTMKHEATHESQSGHNANFARELGRTDARMHDLAERFVDYVERAFQENPELFEEIRDNYDILQAEGPVASPAFDKVKPKDEELAAGNEQPLKQTRGKFEDPISKMVNTGIELVKSSTVGGVATSTMNAISGGLHIGMTSLTSPVAALSAMERAKKWERQGRLEEAKEERAAAKRFLEVGKSMPGATVKAIGESLVDALSVLHLGKGSPHFKEQMDFLRDTGQKELAGDLEKFSNTHVKMGGKLDVAKKVLMIANIMGDRTVNGAYLNAHLGAFMKEIGAKDYTEALRMMDKDKGLKRRFQHYMQEMAGEAFKASWNLPFATEVMKVAGAKIQENPVLNGLSLMVSPFYKAMGANLIMNATEIYPLPALQEKNILPTLGETHTSRRVRNSFNHDSLRQQIRVLEKEVVKISNMQTPNLTALKTVKKKIAEKRKEMRQLEESKIYSIHNARARTVVGPIIMALVAAQRLHRGDDGTEFDQIPGEKDAKGKALTGKFVTAALGEFVVPAFFGDYIGHYLWSKKSGKPFKYETKEGRSKALAYLQESFAGSRYGIPAPAQEFTTELIAALTGKGKQQSTEYLKRLALESVANVGKMAGTLGLPGSLARTYAESKNPEERFSRRTDADTKGPLPGAITKALSDGFKSRIPDLGQGKDLSRLSLPKAPDWKNLSHGQSINEPLDSLTGLTKTKIGPIMRWVNAHQGKVSAGDILPKRTGDPIYDDIHLEEWKKQVEAPRKVRGREAPPLLDYFARVEDWPEKAAIFEIISKFRVARARAAEEAAKRYEELTGKPPERIQERDEKKKEKKELKKQTSILRKVPYSPTSGQPSPPPQP